MFANSKEKAAAGVVILALVLLPAPILPPHRFAEAVQSVLGIGYKAAYLCAVIGLQVILYGSLGLVAAFAIPQASTRRGRLLQLLSVPLAVVAGAVIIRSLKLGHVPVPANAVVSMAACLLGAAFGLCFNQHGWRATLVATGITSAGLLWAYFPGVSSELSRDTEAHLRRQVANAGSGGSGENRFGQLLRTAFAPLDGASVTASRVEHNRAAILALGIALGHERLARFAGLDSNSELVRAAAALRTDTNLRGREDWARHFCLSAALTVLESPFMSDASGLIKEELDALTHGSGFSFGDLAADRAGVRFAEAATATETAAEAMQTRLRESFSMNDFYPPASDLPENLTVEAFRRDYGGVGDQRYRRKIREIETRLDSCPGLSFQPGTHR